MSNYILDSQGILLRLALSLFIGFLVGIDRDDSWQKANTSLRSRFSFIRPGKPAIGLGGVRTYAILALLGSMLGTLYYIDARTLPLMVIVFLGIVSYISIAYFLNFFDRHTLGLTTELGLLLLFAITFALGAQLLDYRIALGIAVLVSLISNLKVEFRNLIGSFTKKEILESIEFVAISAVVLPWLPNVTITLQDLLSYLGLRAGSFGNIAILNPFQFWMVVVFISALNFTGYFLAKTLQSTSSILATAFLGGLVSSTSVTQFLASKSNAAKTSATSKLLVAAVLLANMTSFIRIPLIVLALNPALFTKIVPPLFALTLVTLSIVFFLRKSGTTRESAVTIFSSPLALKPALLFGFLFLVISIASNVGIALLGKAGFIATALIASLSGLDAVTLVTARAVPETIPMLVGTGVLLGATVTNLLFKLGIIAMYGEKRFKKLSFIWLGAITLLGAILLSGIILL